MTTENKRVAAYLPEELYTCLGKFKAENGLSESKAISSILAAHFGVAQEVSQKVAHKFVTTEQFSELQDKVAHLSELLSGLEELRRAGSISANSSNSELESILEEAIHPNQKTIFEATEVFSKSELKDELDSESNRANQPEPLKATALSRRLAKPDHFIANQKKRFKDREDELVEMLRELDLDGWGWRYDLSLKKWVAE